VKAAGIGRTFAAEVYQLAEMTALKPAASSGVSSSTGSVTSISRKQSCGRVLLYRRMACRAACSSMASV